MLAIPTVRVRRSTSAGVEDAAADGVLLDCDKLHNETQRLVRRKTKVLNMFKNVEMSEECPT